MENQFLNLSTNDLKIGDFIGAKHKYGCVDGVIVKIFKSKVVINEYHCFFNHKEKTETITKTENFINVSIKRITEIKK